MIQRLYRLLSSNKDIFTRNMRVSGQDMFTRNMRVSDQDTFAKKLLASSKTLLASSKTLLTSSRNLLAPGSQSCVVCSGLSSGPSASLPLCRKCYSHIAWIKPDDIQCHTCGRYEHCSDCQRRTDTWFEFNMSAVRYDSTMKDWLGRFKYRGDERLQLLFAGMFVSLFERFLDRQQWRTQDISLVTYVPLSKERLEERGFNQAELFAQGLSRTFHLPIIPLLDRIRHTGKQSYKSRSARMEDLQGVFVANNHGMQLLSIDAPTHIILVDDIYTTGSTMNECARVIRANRPNARVFSLTWAR